MDTVVLAYSGGLDTSIAVHWLAKEKNLRVVTFSADLGEASDLESIKERAVKAGAARAYSADLRKTFLEDYCFAALKAGAIYEGRYPLATALGRPLIGAEMVKVARKEKAAVISHGCTGKGNDQVRIEAAVAALAPDLKVIAPLREWSLTSREEEIDYAKQHNIPVPVKKKNPFSVDANLWGRSIECGDIEDPWQEAPAEAYAMTSDPRKAPAAPDYVEVGFERGVPVSVDGKKLDPIALITELNTRAGRHGVGRIDCLENRLVGIKSREIYEAPGALVLHEARKGLAELVQSRDLAHFATSLSQRYAELVYNGLWFGELREALDAYFAHANRNVTGAARVKLYRGSCMTVGRRSPFSQYDTKLATYTVEDVFRHSSAEGFIDLWTLPLRVRAAVEAAQTKVSARTKRPKSK